MAGKCGENAIECVIGGKSEKVKKHRQILMTDEHHKTTTPMK